MSETPVLPFSFFSNVVFLSFALHCFRMLSALSAYVYFYVVSAYVCFSLLNAFFTASTLEDFPKYANLHEDFK